MGVEATGPVDLVMTDRLDLLAMPVSEERQPDIGNDARFAMCSAETEQN